jgi:hypothetical protein
VEPSAPARSPKSTSANGYDNLGQLTAFARGTLSDTNSDGVPDTISSPAHSQSWTLDALGNWLSVTTDGTAHARVQHRAAAPRALDTGVPGNNFVESRYPGSARYAGEPTGDSEFIEGSLFLSAKFSIDRC